MKDFKRYLDLFEKKLHLMEESTDKFLRNHELILSKEDLQITKLRGLESDLRKQFLIAEKIEEENDQICKNKTNKKFINGFLLNFEFLQTF